MSLDAVTIATQFIDEIVQGRFEDGAARFDEAVKAVLPVENLRATWQALENQIGTFQRQAETQVKQVQGFEQVIVTCDFTSGRLEIVVTVDPDQRIGGLFVNPLVPVQEAEQHPPSEAFAESEVQVGRGAWTLPGTLTLPAGTGPFPAVVLVHGSGPQDRDETIGSNKPFRDLAWGLAERQIAVLRYEKRTKVYGQQIRQELGTLTVQEETIEDGLAACDLLRASAWIDPRRIFVLGHSLGGYLLPRIGLADPALAGLIVFAGSTRPLEDLIVEQMTYILSTQETVTEAQQHSLEITRQQAALVKSPDLTPETPATELPFGVPAAYWLDLRDYQPALLARQLPQPLLIMQGESDYQVTMQDFAGWQQALNGKPGVTFKSYPGLHHLFMPVADGKMATPIAYAVTGHIEAYVLEDLAHWIKSH